MSRFQSEVVLTRIFNPATSTLMTEEEYAKWNAARDIDKELAYAEKEMMANLARRAQERELKSRQQPKEKRKHMPLPWIQKFIEENNAVTLNKILMRMQDRNYPQGKINQQIRWIEEAYEFEENNIIGLKGESQGPKAPSSQSKRDNGTVQKAHDSNSETKAEDKDMATKTKKKAAASSGVQGRKSAYAGKTIKSAVKENPYRAGSNGEKKFAIILKAGASGLKYEDYLKAGGKSTDIAWNVKHDYVNVS